MAEISFADLVAAARVRLLNREADKAGVAAARTRNRKPWHPGFAAAMEADALALDEYAAACRKAAADPNLPPPSGPHYPRRSHA